MKDILLQNVSKAFEGKLVLDRVSLAFPAGAVSCLMGPSGIGKTTVFRLLMGVEQPDFGQVTGVPPHISAVFQEDRLCEGFSAVDNVRFVTGNAVPVTTIEQHLLSLGLPGDSLQQPVATLSGGMRRRVVLVRAVLADSDLLLLDEAFKGLDADTRAQTIAYVLKHRAGRTLIAITHEKEEAALLNGQLVLMPGTG